MTCQNGSRHEIPPPACLRTNAGNTIWLDANAAGWGWFVDRTPWGTFQTCRHTPGNQGEQHRIDLLTVLDHELGHLLGLDHEAIGVMADTLAAGTRRTPSAGGPTDWLAAIDVMFAEPRLSKRRR